MRLKERFFRIYRRNVGLGISFIFFCSIFIHSHAQQYWQQKVNYDISVTLNDKTHTLSGFEKFVYVNNSPDQLDKLYIHLWPNAYMGHKTALGHQLYGMGETNLRFGKEDDKGWIDSLNFQINNQPIQWQFDPKHPDICLLQLPNPILPGDSILVTTPFKVKIPSGNISRLGHIDQAYQITQWYPKPAVYDKNGWHPIPYLDQGEFYSEYGSFDVQITLPKNYVLAATGDLQTESEKEFLEGKVRETAVYLKTMLEEEEMGYGQETPIPPSEKEFKTVRFTQSNVHDFAWFADKRYAVMKGSVLLPHSQRTVSTWTMFIPSNVKNWKNAIEYVNDGTYYYSLWNGDYPYNNVTAVDGSISAGGGMEYPTITVIGETLSEEDLEVVIVHEVGHNWFYGILGSNERQHGWMDEGINTFNEMRYIQTKYPHNERLSEMLLGGRFHFDKLSHHDMGDFSYRAVAALGEDEAIETSSEKFGSLNYSVIMYQKTGLVFHYLQDYLGEELFDKCMQSYFEEWKFKHPQPQDLQAVFEKVSEKKLSWVFQDLIRTTKKVDYKLKRVKSDEKSTLVTVKNVGQVKGPIEVNIIGDTNEIASLWTEPGIKKSTLHFPIGNAEKVCINYDKSIPELNRQNNSWHNTGLFKRFEPLKCEFLIGDKETDHTNIFWTPVVAGNFYDKFMIGGAIHNMGIPFPKWQFLIAPMYSFGRNMVSGIAEISLATYPVRALKVSRFGLSIKSFKMDSSTVIRKQDGAYLAFAPYYFAKLGERKTNHWNNSLLLQGIIRYSIYGKLLNDYYGGFANLQTELNYPDHRMKLAVRTDVLSAQDLDFARIMVTSGYRYKYLKNNMQRWVEIRLFAGNTFFTHQKKIGTNYYRYSMSMSGSDGAQDLYLEDYYFGRGLIDGMWSQQRAENMGGFKSTSYYGTTMNWMASANLNVQLPIPRVNFIGWYADAGIFHNGTSANTLWNTGISIRFANFFAMYFPVAMSKELDQSFGNSRYVERIRFTLRLNPVNRNIRINTFFE